MREESKRGRKKKKEREEKREVSLCKSISDASITADVLAAEAQIGM